MILRTYEHDYPVIGITESTEKYDTYIMPGSVPGFYRVSHMGLQTKEELDLLASRIHELE